MIDVKFCTYISHISFEKFCLIINLNFFQLDESHESIKKWANILSITAASYLNDIYEALENGSALHNGKMVIRYSYRVMYFLEICHGAVLVSTPIILNYGYSYIVTYYLIYSVIS